VDKPVFSRSPFPGENADDWAARFFEAAAQTGKLYRADGEGFIYLSGAAAPKRILNDIDAYGCFHSVVNVVQVRRGRDGAEEVQAAFLSQYELRVLFAHPASVRLPEIRAVVTDPVVVPLAGGGYGAVPEGYDNQYGSGIYYWVKPGQKPITPSDSVQHLTTLFSGLPFADIRARNNLLAWLLGGVCLDKKLDSPLLVVCANTQGVGKSSTVQALGHVLYGSLPAPIDFSTQEFSKQLSTRFLEGDKLMLLDNIVCSKGRSFDNTTLSSLLTQGPSKRIRILGHSRSISASGILFAATLNDGRLSTDLSDRSLIVRLYKENASPMVPYCRDYAIEHREELYSELLGLALRPAPAVKIGSPQFRFRRWLEFVTPRISAHWGALDIEENVSMDDLSQEFFAWGADRIDDEIEVKDLLARVEMDSGNLYPSLYDKVTNYKSQRAKATWAGTFLRSKVNQYFNPAPGLRLRFLLLQTPTDKGHPQYVFREVKE
jgi:hypothetical protein